MTYHQAFDRLGNPVHRRGEQPLGHKIIQRAGFVACVVGLVLLYGVR